MNKYGTKALTEMKIVNHQDAIEEIFSALSKAENIAINTTNLQGMKILILDYLPLARFLAPNNRMTMISGKNQNTKEFTKQYPSCKVIHINNYNNLEKIMKNNFKENTMDFIFANPPYKKQLYLDIAQILLPYINDTGTLNILGPIDALTIPKKHTKKSNHVDLWTHLKCCGVIPRDKYDLFESYKGYSDLGIMRFVKHETGFNISNAWKQFYAKAEANLIKKVQNLSIKTISNEARKNCKQGLFVPIGLIGGKKRFLPYANFLYCNNGICYIRKKKKGKFEIEEVPISKCKHQAIKKGVAVRAIYFNTVGEALRFHTLYKNSYILKGLFGLSLNGTAHPTYEMIPYFKCDHKITNNEIIDRLQLSEEELDILHKYAINPDKLKNNGMNYTEKIF